MPHLTVTVTVETLGAAMRLTRKEARINTAEMAEAFDVAERTIHRWETDKSLPPVRRLVLTEWAELTGKDADFFDPFLGSDLLTPNSTCTSVLANVA